MAIVFYRDGVSEGQFYQVLLHELEAIRKVTVSILFGMFSGDHLVLNESVIQS